MKFFLQEVILFLCKIKIFPSRYVVRIDGGICSQMNQYLIGEFFKKNKKGSVHYDLTFYKVSGMDVDGKQVRNFDLLKMFPNLTFKKRKGIADLITMRLFKVKNKDLMGNKNTWMDITPPAYLGDYYDCATLYRSLFGETYKLSPDVLNSSEKEKYYSIRNKNTVAVHIRRGDLAVYMDGYGTPASVDYFVKAINFINSQATNMFYFFSDDYDYVKKEIIPKLDKDIIYEFSNNGSDRGYVDLMYISRCQHQITSKGSLGKFGAFLGMQNDKIVIIPKGDAYMTFFKGMPCKLIEM